MVKIIATKTAKGIVLSLLGAFALGVAGCEAGYERGEIGEEREEEGVIGEEGIGEGAGGIAEEEVEEED